MQNRLLDYFLNCSILINYFDFSNKNPEGDTMFYIKQLLHFTYEQALSCLFPVIIFLTLALSKIVSIPGLYRYDFILIACLLMQWIMYKTGLETKDELKVITVFHLIGLLLEIYKVHFGSWSYPEEAYSKILSSALQRLYVRECRKLHMPSVEKVAFTNALLAESYFTVPLEQ